MCKIEAKNQRTILYIALTWISSSLAMAIIALVANLSFWTAVAAIAPMAICFVFCLNARSNIWVLLSKLPKLKECLYNSNASKDCLNLFDSINSTLIATHVLLIICSILVASAAAIAWLPLWGAIAIGIAIGMIGTCLGFIIYLIALYNRLINCIP